MIPPLAASAVEFSLVLIILIEAGTCRRRRAGRATMGQLVPRSGHEGVIDTAACVVI